MKEDLAFERIREEVSRDLHPVRPLQPPWIGALIVLPLAVLLLSLLWLVYGLRSDAATLGLWPLGAPVALMVVGAYAIFYLALVQRSPESTTRGVWWTVMPLAIVGLQAGGGLLTLSAAGPDPASVPLRAEAMCSWRISVLAVPAVLLAFWMLTRGLPSRPRVVGLLAGLGGGFLTEGIYRMYCPLSDPSHILPWHTGAVLALGIAGLLAGLRWERRRLRRWV